MIYYNKKGPQFSLFALKGKKSKHTDKKLNHTNILQQNQSPTANNSDVPLKQFHTCRARTVTPKQFDIETSFPLIKSPLLKPLIQRFASTVSGVMTQKPKSRISLQPNIKTVDITDLNPFNHREGKYSMKRVDRLNILLSVASDCN